jgi:ATP-dependent RNA helicase DDX52/ROK1
MQSGQAVPDWIIKLPKPSKMKRKAMGKVKRPEIVNNARNIGRQDAMKKRYAFSEWVVVKVHPAAFVSDIIATSKRGKTKTISEVEQQQNHKHDSLGGITDTS